jgi:fumarate reductase flavoprotein subunit
MKVIKTELAVMGSGLAGLSAALRARKAGVDAALFEKRPFQGGGVSNTPMMTMGCRPEREFQDKAFEIHMDYTRWNANAAAVRSWIKYSSQIKSFINDELGLSFLGARETSLEEMGTYPGYGACFPKAYAIGDFFYFKPIGQGHGAAVICKRMADLFRKEGGQVYFNTPIQKLMREGDKVTGAIAWDRAAEEQVVIEAKAFVIASGGFSDDAEMVQKELGVKLGDKNLDNEGDVFPIHFNNAQMMGDGIKAVWEIGGAKGSCGINTGTSIPGPGVVGNNVAWLHMSPLSTLVEQPYLHVNKYGERYMSEVHSDEHQVTYTCVNNQPDKKAYIIFDADVVERLQTKGVERSYFIFDIPTIDDVHGKFDALIKQGNKHVFFAGTIEELAGKAGIDVAGLKATVERYNGFCDAGYDEDFGVKSECLFPVRKSKFYAVRAALAAYHAFGGIRINGKCEVLDTALRPIKGLYAAGDCCAAEIFGNPPIGGIGISTISFSQGFICAEESVKYVK